jgi:hypothetical protein
VGGKLGRFSAKPCQAYYIGAGKLMSGGMISKPGDSSQGVTVGSVSTGEVIVNGDSLGGTINPGSTVVNIQQVQVGTVEELLFYR